MYTIYSVWCNCLCCCSIQLHLPLCTSSLLYHWVTVIIHGIEPFHRNNRKFLRTFLATLPQTHDKHMIPYHHCSEWIVEIMHFMFVEEFFDYRCSLNRLVLTKCRNCRIKIIAGKSWHRTCDRHYWHLTTNILYGA